LASKTKEKRLIPNKKNNFSNRNKSSDQTSQNGNLIITSFNLTNSNQKNHHQKSKSLENQGQAKRIIVS
jgi:hypothetical protein